MKLVTLGTSLNAKFTHSSEGTEHMHHDLNNSKDGPPTNVCI